MPLSHSNIIKLVVSDAAEEGVWKNHYTGEYVDTVTGVYTIDGGTKENCGIVCPPWQGWTDWNCVIGTSSK